jgi:hypothetical protein
MNELLTHEVLAESAGRQDLRRPQFIEVLRQALSFPVIRLAERNLPDVDIW